MQRVLLHLTDEITQKLKSEKNMSALVDVMLANHYNIELDTQGFVGAARADAMALLDNYEVPYDVTDVEAKDENLLADDPEVIPEPLPEVAEPHVFAEAAPEPAVAEVGGEPVVEPTITYTSDPPTEPMVVEVPAAETPVAPVVETTPEAPTEDPLPDLPVNIDGQPAKQCPTCGNYYLGGFCIDCL